MRKRLGTQQNGAVRDETLALAENRAALATLNGQWIDRFTTATGLKFIVLGHGQLGPADPW